MVNNTDFNGDVKLSYILVDEYKAPYKFYRIYKNLHLPVEVSPFIRPRVPKDNRAFDSMMFKGFDFRYDMIPVLRNVVGFSYLKIRHENDLMILSLKMLEDI